MGICQLTVSGDNKLKTLREGKEGRGKKTGEKRSSASNFTNYILLRLI